MAISPLGSEFKGLTFDGVSSKTYGVQIYGEGVFNAPDRDVEMITIPGRSGAFALDKGRFENIPVTYPAILLADSAEDFADAISDFRNQLCSRKGYCRLADDYHPDEYRMAVYKSGLEVDEEVLRTGKFNIVFDCMPQRFLTSGETAVTITSGGTITNPTMHEARPLLEVVGYGTIEFGGKSIILNDVKFVNVDYPFSQIPSGSIRAKDLSDGRVAVGDTVTASNVRFVYSIEFPAGYTVTGHTLAVQSSEFTHVLNINRHGRFIEVTVSATSIEMAYTTSTNAKNVTLSGYINYTNASGTAGQVAATGSAQYQIYDGTEARLSISISTNNNNLVTRVQDVMCSGVSAVSSVSALGGTSYIDCESGIAYRYINSLPVGINKAVTLPAELPELKAGSNTITYSNTITDFKVVPRWWKV